MKEQITPLPVLATGEQLSLPRTSDGRILWSEISQDEDRLKNVIETLSRSFLESGLDLTGRNLFENGLGSLGHAIIKYYPGKFPTLKENLGLAIKHDSDYSQITYDERGLPWDSGGRVRWSRLKDDPVRLQELVEKEAMELVKLGSTLTQQSLKELGRQDLLRPILVFYPQGIRGLREKLGLRNKKRNNGYWQESEIEKSAQQFIASGKDLTYSNLYESGDNALAVAIKRRYKGGITALKMQLNEVSQKPKNYWKDLLVIEREAQDFLSSGNPLNHKSLVESGRHDLDRAIQKYYPGGFPALREELKIAKMTFSDVLESYEQALESTGAVPFAEFLKGEK